MKLCSSCDENKSDDLFNKRKLKSGKEILQPYCRECNSIYLKGHYKDNKKYYIEKSAKRKAGIARFISELKTDLPCTDCKNTFPPYVMDFDHLGDKLDNISNMINYASLQQILEEITKCEIVCSNCHRIRTHNRGVS